MAETTNNSSEKKEQPNPMLAAEPVPMPIKIRAADNSDYELLASVNKRKATILEQPKPAEHASKEHKLPSNTLIIIAAVSLVVLLMAALAYFYLYRGGVGLSGQTPEQAAQSTDTGSPKTESTPTGTAGQDGEAGVGGTPQTEEAEKAKLERIKQAASEARRKKQEAFNKFYKKTSECENPKDWEQIVKCSNEAMDARAAFDAQYKPEQ